MSNPPLSCLVPINVTKNSKPALICVPGAGSLPTAFQDLSVALGDQFSIYGYQPRGFRIGEKPLPDVQSAARELASCLRDSNPNQHYFFIGHSFGGWIALETARLVKHPCQQASVALLDTKHPDTCESVREISKTTALLKLLDLYELRLGRSLKVHHEHLSSMTEAKQLAYAAKLLSNTTAHRYALPPHHLHTVLNVFHANLNSNYALESEFAGRVHLILARPNNTPYTPAQTPELDEVVIGWSAALPHLTYSYSPGNHVTMLNNPHARSLAASIASFFHFI